MIHGGIDGYSRSVTYLQCSSNNKSVTVLRLFQNAVVRYSLPSRVRADFGINNVKTARYMLECSAGGINRESFITGKSLHSENRKAVENIKRLRNSLKTGSFIFVK